MNVETYIVQPEHPFSGYQSKYDEAEYVFIGFPYDATSTYRLGSKDAPEAIRKASLNIETYSFMADIFVEDLNLHDLGNVKAEGNQFEVFQNLKTVVSTVLKENKTPIILGGEHTLTYTVIEALPENTGIISFDAHFDLRDEYAGNRFSHATFMRRVAEKIGGDRIFFIGVRATCKEELEYVKQNQIGYIPPWKLNREEKRIAEFANRFPSIYLSVDLDVFDPSYAPAVGNPEPGGISPEALLDIAYKLKGGFVGFDIVELTPNYDFGVTSIHAAKIIFELLCLIEKGKQER